MYFTRKKFTKTIVTTAYYLNGYYSKGPLELIYSKKLRPSALRNPEAYTCEDSRESAKILPL